MTKSIRATEKSKRYGACRFQNSENINIYNYNKRLGECSISNKISYKKARRMVMIGEKQIIVLTEDCFITRDRNE